MFNTQIQSYLDVTRRFSTEKKCLKHLEQIYWPDGIPISPFDKFAGITRCKDGRYKCKTTKKYFTIKNGTMFAGTKIGLPTWFAVMYQVTSNPQGINAKQISRDFNISQKSAWFLLHRIREAFGVENSVEEAFDGICEADETFVGGKNQNRHRDKKVPRSQGRSFKDKTPVLGVLQRGEYEYISRPDKVMPEFTVREKVAISYSKVRLRVAADTKKKTIHNFVNLFVEEGTRLNTDEWKGYGGLGAKYSHRIVDHSKKQYVDLDNPCNHTNGIEGFWSIFKKGYKTYVWWSRKHMQRYCDEYAWRFNLRGLSTSDRYISLFLNGRTVRTKYRELTSGKA